MGTGWGLDTRSRYRLARGFENDSRLTRCDALRCGILAGPVLHSFGNQSSQKLKSLDAEHIIPVMLSARLEIRKTNQTLHCGDGREMGWIPDESVHLVVTSPPYWTLKEYPPNRRQLGLISDYEKFHDEL